MPRNQKARKDKEKQAKQILLVGAIALVLVLIGVVSFLDPKAPAEVSVQQAYEMCEQGALILDVREPEEWNQHHIPGATLIPLGQLASRINELPHDRQIVVVCRSGNRSQAGRDILLEARFGDVTSMAGGMNDWISAGFEIATEP